MDRWSDSGGDIVPDVMCVSVSVVRMTSMSVFVLWCGSYRVGVVMVVCRLLVSSSFVNGCSGVSRNRSMLMSPWIVMDVRGCFVRMLLIAV